MSPILYLLFAASALVMVVCLAVLVAAARQVRVHFQACPGCSDLARQLQDAQVFTCPVCGQHYANEHAVGQAGGHLSAIEPGRVVIVVPGTKTP